jgi:flagellar biosynthesis/type III secretory pathway M-ring protein FliF/YscJ
MDEIEVPLEQTQEHLQHASLHGHNSGGGFSLINIGAVLSAVIAVFAAICALLAGHYSNEAMIEQIKSSDQWSYYQAKGIKSAMQEFRLEAGTGLSVEKIEKIQAKIEKYKEDQEHIQEIAKEKEESSEKFLHWHERLAMAVTFFQVAIAVIAIGVLTRKKLFVAMGAGSGLIGLGAFISFFFIS